MNITLKSLILSMIFGVIFLNCLNFISAESWKYNYLPEDVSSSSITINESNFEHNLLEGLQGTGTSYWHLNDTQYNNLGYCSLTNGTFLTTTYANNTFKKYSDFNYVSVSNAKLDMPKAGYNYFYLDEDVNWSLINVSNGTLNIPISSSSGWLLDSGVIYYLSGTRYCDNSGDWTTICPKNDLLEIRTAINNLTLIFPSTVSASDYRTLTNTTFNNINVSNTIINSTGTLTANLSVTYIKLNEVSGICDLTRNHTICSNATGTYIKG
jgi:hypothetical protein